MSNKVYGNHTVYCYVLYSTISISRRRAKIVFVRPYRCQRYNSIRGGRPAGDNEAGLMSVDAQDVRCRIMGLHKWLLRI